MQTPPQRCRCQCTTHSESEHCCATETLRARVSGRYACLERNIYQFHWCHFLRPLPPRPVLPEISALAIMKLRAFLLLNPNCLPGLQAVAEVDAPGPHDFMAQSPKGSVKRLLALDCIQDPGNLVLSCFYLFAVHCSRTCDAVSYLHCPCTLLLAISVCGVLRHVWALPWLPRMHSAMMTWVIVCRAHC